MSQVAVDYGEESVRFVTANLGKSEYVSLKYLAIDSTEKLDLFFGLINTRNKIMRFSDLKVIALKLFVTDRGTKPEFFHFRLAIEPRFAPLEKALARNGDPQSVQN